MTAKLSYADVKKSLDHLKEQVTGAMADCIGYPVAKDFDYSDLYHFLDTSINNIGDPFEDSTYRVQTHDMEREVVAFFARLFRANPRDFWGYITNGGSESNLYGLYLAREMYPKGIVYYSESTHYSVRKNIHLLNIPAIVIRSQENGEMDYEDFENTLRFNRHKPAIVLTTFGTTMTEAKDDIIRVKQILRKLAIHDHYVHVDGALAGSFAPFIQPRLPFDFMDGADSVAISGHKFIGSPMPCGIVITKKSLRDRIAKGISYIGASDTTISGSRNGHSVLFMWYAIKKMGVEGLRARYLECLDTAKYCEARLNEVGIKAWRNEGAITVVLPRVSDTVKHKWQLATEGDTTHIICMPKVTKTQIDQFVADVQAMPIEEEVEEFEYAF
jgi:histidine decarboxylase